MGRTEAFTLLTLYLFLFVKDSHQLTGLEQCSLEDSVCLTTQAQRALQDFIEGMPKLGINSMKQLHLDPIILQTPNFSYNWTDLLAKGYENAVFDDVSIDMSLKTMRVSFHTTIQLYYHYQTSGLFFNTIPIYGNGKGEITLENTQLEILFIFDIVKRKNGKDYMDLKTYYYGFNAVDGAYFYFENLYDGDKAKSDALHKLLNTNWRTIIANFGGYLNRKMTDKIFDAVKIYMASRPLEDLALYE